MLNIGKLLRGREDYYLNAVARSQEEYYTGAGEAPGRWLGGGAAELGLAGEVSERGLHEVLEGIDPVGGGRLVMPSRPGRVAGFDLTFRAPKSVALLYGLGPSAVARDVRWGHRRAVAAALAYLERHAAMGRRGHNGVVRVEGNGFVAAAFEHRTSRAGDPLLHTHVLVANATRGPDGRWTALDGRVLYAHAKTAGFVYQAVLRHELTRTLGVAWTPARRGSAEVAGVPRRVIKVFSKRRQQIVERMAELGVTSAKGAQVATLDTRTHKPPAMSSAGLRNRWVAEAAAHSLDIENLVATLGQAEPAPLAADDVEQLVRYLTGPEGLTRHASTFDRRDVVRGVCEALAAGGTLEQVERLTGQVLARAGLVVRLDPSTALSAGGQRYTTAELLAVEAELLRSTARRQDAGVGMVAPVLADMSLIAHARPGRVLGPDQVRMVNRLTTSGEGVQVVDAKAGSGKTTALSACRMAWESGGYQVIGAALAGRAAKELQASAGIPSTTIARLLADLDQGATPGLAPGTVLVIDEAAMVDTRTLARLLDHAERAASKIVLIGDVEQLPEIGAGGAFRALHRTLHSVSLDRNRRQHEPWEVEALDLLRDGNPAVAVAKYLRHDRIVVRDTATDLRQQLIDDWWTAARLQERPPVIIAARRADVAELNQQARAKVAEAGLLSTTTLTVAGREFAVGDRVVTLRNAYRLGVTNGTTATITSIDRDSRSLTIRTDDGTTVRLPAGYLHTGGARRLDHGYAITAHRAQGMTTERAFVLGTDELYKEWSYVAMSRGRAENRLYLVSGDNPWQPELDVPQGPASEPMEQLVRNLGRSQAKQLATTSLAEPLDPRHPEPPGNHRAAPAPSDHAAPQIPVGSTRQTIPPVDLPEPAPPDLPYP